MIVIEVEDCKEDNCKFEPEILNKFLRRDRPLIVNFKSRSYLALEIFFTDEDVSKKSGKVAYKKISRTLDAFSGLFSCNLLENRLKQNRSKDVRKPVEYGSPVAFGFSNFSPKMWLNVGKNRRSFRIEKDVKLATLDFPFNFEKLDSCCLICQKGPSLLKIGRMIHELNHLFGVLNECESAQGESTF